MFKKHSFIIIFFLIALTSMVTIACELSDSDSKVNQVRIANQAQGTLLQVKLNDVSFGTLNPGVKTGYKEITGLSLNLTVGDTVGDNIIDVIIALENDTLEGTDNQYTLNISNLEPGSIRNAQGEPYLLFGVDGRELHDLYYNQNDRWSSRSTTLKAVTENEEFLFDRVYTIDSLSSLEYAESTTDSSLEIFANRPQSGSTPASQYLLQTFNLDFGNVYNFNVDFIRSASGSIYIESWDNANNVISIEAEKIGTIPSLKGSVSQD